MFFSTSNQMRRRKESSSMRSMDILTTLTVSYLCRQNSVSPQSWISLRESHRIGLIKINSSGINSNGQDEYYAVSVSPSDVAEVRSYIRNQEDHHRVRTFQEEYEEMLRNFVHYKDIQWYFRRPKGRWRGFRFISAHPTLKGGAIDSGPDSNLSHFFVLWNSLVSSFVC